jgi:hypothetical protein
MTRLTNTLEACGSQFPKRIIPFVLDAWPDCEDMILVPQALVKRTSNTNVTIDAWHAEHDHEYNRPLAWLSSVLFFLFAEAYPPVPGRLQIVCMGVSARNLEERVRRMAAFDHQIFKGMIGKPVRYALQVPHPAVEARGRKVSVPGTRHEVPARNVLAAAFGAAAGIPTSRRSSRCFTTRPPFGRVLSRTRALTRTRVRIKPGAPCA